MIWLTEQSPFDDRTVKSSNKFIFSWEQILNFSEELLLKFENLKNIMSANDIELNVDIERYHGIITRIKEK
ncbi:hypothetical protein D1872_291170 [compost metagenome]